jgi:hypothetical protein
MFNWLSKLLHWRQGNDVIVKGRQTQFIPWNGVYVIARQYNGKTALTILNGTSKQAVLEVGRYAEVIGNVKRGKDVITGRNVALDKNVNLRPRQTLIVEF